MKTKFIFVTGGVLSSLGKGLAVASLGALRCEVAKQMGLVDPMDFKFLWVTEFPLLEYSEEDGRFYAKHHPFTMPMEEDLQYIDSDPGRVRAKAYDIVLNGTELGGGSIRIHSGEIQSKMFEVLGFTPEDAQEKFGFLLEAFKYGVPPHGGLAFGLDRLVALSIGLEDIRDVIDMASPTGGKQGAKVVETAKGKMSPKQKDKLIAELTAEMRSAAAKLEFEKADYLRDRIKRIQGGEEI